jgi:hypothetical protein
MRSWHPLAQELESGIRAEMLPSQPGLVANAPDPMSNTGDSPMTNASRLITRLQSLIGDDAHDDNIHRQASNAIVGLLARKDGDRTELSLPEEPTDHEAEGAMIYVMSRGK